MTDAFISYSRKDKQFVQKLYEALRQEKRDIWVDWQDIPPTAEWRQEIAEGIEAADNVIFVISPDFVASSECYKELEHAIKNNKRLVPIVWREVEANRVRLEVSKLNWIFFRESDDFHSSLQLLREALDLDLKYVKEHTRLLNRALEWKKRERNPSWLLRGRDLKEAEQWLAQADQEPNPTQLHNRYLIASVENRRKFWVRITSIIGVLTVAVMVLASVAVIEEKRATKAKIKAKKSQIQALTDFSEASRLKDEQLEALIASTIAAKKLQELKIVTDTEPLYQRVVAALRNAVYNVEEFNHLPDNTTEVYSVRFSPDSQLIASASGARVTLWQPNGQKFPLQHEDKVWKISFFPNPESLLIASASEDKTVKLWKREKNGNWNLETTLHHSVPVRAVAFPTSQTCSEQVIASAGIDGIVRLWSLDGKLQKTFPAHESQINDVRFSPDCQTIATASNDRTVKLWSWQGKWKKTLEGHESYVSEVDFSPDGKKIVTASFDNTVKLWNLEGEMLQTLSGHSNWVTTVAFSPNGKLIISGSEDDTVKIWSSNEGSLLQTFRGHRSGVNSIRFSPDGNLIASASDKKVRLWKMEGIVIHRFHGHKSSVRDVSFSPNNKLIASASFDKTVIFWPNNNQPQLVTPEKILKDEAALRKVDFTPDGNNLVTVSKNNLRLWNIENIEDVLTSQPDNPLAPKNFQGRTSIVNSFSISPDGKPIASASVSGSVKLWEINKKKRIKDFEKEHKSEVEDVSFSPDGQLIVSVGADGLGKIWNINGTLLQTLKGHQERINAVAFSHDGKLIATASSDRTIILWKLNQEKSKFEVFKTLKGHQDGVWDVTFSPEGKMIASAGRDDTVKLWNLKGKLIVTLRGHKDWIRAVSFSHDGEKLKLASASADKTIILWDIKEILAIEKEPVLDSLLDKGCQWLSEYLNTQDLNTHQKQDQQTLRDLRSACQKQESRRLGIFLNC